MTNITRTLDRLDRAEKRYGWLADLILVLTYIAVAVQTHGWYSGLLFFMAGQRSMMARLGWDER